VKGSRKVLEDQKVLRMWRVHHGGLDCVTAYSPEQAYEVCMLSTYESMEEAEKYESESDYRIEEIDPDEDLAIRGWDERVEEQIRGLISRGSVHDVSMLRRSLNIPRECRMTAKVREWLRVLKEPMFVCSTEY